MLSAICYLLSAITPETSLTDYLFACLLALLIIFAIGSAALIVTLLWAAKGSPDVNGDPERDSGLTDPQIRAAYRRDLKSGLHPAEAERNIVVRTAIQNRRRFHPVHPVKNPSRN